MTAPLDRAQAAVLLADLGSLIAAGKSGGAERADLMRRLAGEGWTQDEIAAAAAISQAAVSKALAVAQGRQWLSEAAGREGRSPGAVISASLERDRVLSDAGLALLDRDQTRAMMAYLRSPGGETAAALDQAADRFRAALGAWKPGT